MLLRGKGMMDGGEDDSLFFEGGGAGGPEATAACAAAEDALPPNRKLMVEFGARKKYQRVTKGQAHVDISPPHFNPPSLPPHSPLQLLSHPSFPLRSCAQQQQQHHQQQQQATTAAAASASNNSSSSIISSSSKQQAAISAHSQRTRERPQPHTKEITQPKTCSKRIKKRAGRGWCSGLWAAFAADCKTICTVTRQTFTFASVCVHLCARARFALVAAVWCCSVCSMLSRVLKE